MLLLRKMSLWGLSLLFLLPPILSLGQAMEERSLVSQTVERQPNGLIDYAEKQVEAGKIPGGVNLVYQNGKMIQERTFGYRNIETKEPVPMDGIFYIQSMTKPLVSVALMMLYEEGHFELDDEVTKYLPQFGDQEVAQFEGEDESGKMTTVPAENAITIKQLFSHTAGKRHGIMGSELDKVYLRKLYLMPHKTIEDRVDALAKAPLQCEPGTEWHYSATPDVLALLIEKFSGMTCAEFLQTRLFDPLEMNDTGYNVPEEKKDRIMTVHGYDKEGKLKVEGRQPQSSKNTVFGGTHGMFSTAADYMNFAQMLLNKGSFKGKRLVSPKTIELMTMDHVGEIYPDPGLGFGLGFAVVTDVAELAALGSKGTFFWNGAFNTYFFVDPQEQLISVFMMQTSPYNGFYERKHRHFIYQGLD